MDKIIMTTEEELAAKLQAEYNKGYHAGSLDMMNTLLDKIKEEIEPKANSRMGGAFPERKMDITTH